MLGSHWVITQCSATSTLTRALAHLVSYGPKLVEVEKWNLGHRHHSWYEASPFWVTSHWPNFPGCVREFGKDVGTGNALLTPKESGKKKLQNIWFSVRSHLVTKSQFNLIFQTHWCTREGSAWKPRILFQSRVLYAQVVSAKIQCQWRKFPGQRCHVRAFETRHCNYMATNWPVL